MKKIITISGSLRKDSLNTKLIEAAEKLIGDKGEITRLSIDSVPLYNQDLEPVFPESVKAFKEALRAADAIIIATPEYNRSVPGVLKNAIDWASRPYGDNAFAKKPVLVLGATGGNIGTSLAQYHLKQVMLYLDANLVAQPEIFVGGATDKLNKETGLYDEATLTHLQKGIDALMAKC
jgi:chromate reductase